MSILLALLLLAAIVAADPSGLRGGGGGRLRQRRLAFNDYNHHATRNGGQDGDAMRQGHAWARQGWNDGTNPQSNRQGFTNAGSWNGYNWNSGPDSCPSAQCWSHSYKACFHITSQECLNPAPTRTPTPRPTSHPTAEPTFGMEITVHPVKVTLENVPDDFSMTPEIRAMIVRYATETIEKELEEPMQLIEVELAGFIGDRRKLGKRTRRGRRRLASLSVPLRVTIKGPANMSDFALAFITDAIQPHLDNLMNELRSYDYDSFSSVSVSTSTYNINDISEKTDKPTARPTPRPTARLVETEHAVQVILRGVRAGYAFSLETKGQIIRYVKTKLEEGLGEDLEFVDVSYAGIVFEDEDFAPRLPLRVIVRGTPDITDFALSFILDAMRDIERELGTFLRTLDRAAFEEPKPDFGTFALDDVVDTSVTEETVLPIRFIFEGLPFGYTLSLDTRSDIIQYIEDLLEDNLGGLFELIEVMESATMVRRLTRRLQIEVALPLLIEVRGPAELSDLAGPYIVQVLRDNIPEMKSFLWSLDRDVFENPRVIAEIYDPDELPVRSMGDEDTSPLALPWWVWLLVGVGASLLVCCVCVCCRCCSRYRGGRKKKGKKELEMHDNTLVGEEQLGNKPIIIEKPVIVEVEKPVIIEKEVPRKKKKKHRKRKKERRKRESKPLQIEQEQSYSGPIVAVPNNLYASDLTCRSGITFQNDPPPESWAYSRAPSFANRLALPASADDRLQICQHPYEQSAAASSQGDNVLKLMYGNEGQSHYTKESRSALVRNIKEPSGHDWAEVQRHLDASDGDSYPTKPPEQRPSQTGSPETEDRSDIFTTFDDPCFSVATGVDDSHRSAVAEATAAAHRLSRTSGRSSRHLSGGVDSVDHTDDWLDDDSAFLVRPMGKSF